MIALVVLVSASVSAGVAYVVSRRARPAADTSAPSEPKPKKCVREYCEAWRLSSCGSGHCAGHHHLYCIDLLTGRGCDDPRPVPVGQSGHRPTIIKGGKD